MPHDQYIVCDSLTITTAIDGPAALWTMEEEKQMQRVENRVWRHILGAPEYTPVVALQREIGASTVEGRDMKIKMTFAQYMLRTKNGLLRAIFKKMLEEARPKKWIRQFRQYMGELGLGLLQVGEMGGAVSGWEGDRWRREVESKSTLQLYRHKIGIGDEGIYSNRYLKVWLLPMLGCPTVQVIYLDIQVNTEISLPRQN